MYFLNIFILPLPDRWVSFDEALQTFSEMDKVQTKTKIQT